MNHVIFQYHFIYIQLLYLASRNFTLILTDIFFKRENLFSLLVTCLCLCRIFDVYAVLFSLSQQTCFLSRSESYHHFKNIYTFFVSQRNHKKNIEDAFRTFCQGKFTLQRSRQDYKTTVYSPEEQYRPYNSPGRDTAIW